MLLFSCFINEDSKARRGESLTLGHTVQGGHIRTGFKPSHSALLWAASGQKQVIKKQTLRSWSRSLKSHTCTRNSRNWEMVLPQAQTEESLEKNQAKLSSWGPPPGVLKKAAEEGDRWGPWTRQLIFVKWSKTKVLLLARQEKMPVFLPALIRRE